MTDNYKEQLLDYITGDLTIESGVNEPNIVLNESTPSNYREKIVPIIQNLYGENANFIEQSFLTFSNTDKKIIYGYAFDGEVKQTGTGLLIIVDENFQYLDCLTAYSSGTQFNKFEMLKVDEDNTIYGVENVGTEGNNKYRFVMLNDILGTYLLDETYVCELRKSYNFPSAYNSIYLYRNRPYPRPMSIQNQLYKEYEGSSYCFIGYTANNYPTVITLKVNVGEENEWHQYTSNYAIYGTSGIASYCVWQNDTINLIIGCISSNNNYYFEFSFNGSSLTRTKNIACNGIYSIEMQNLNDVYIIQVDFVNDVTNYLKINGTTLTNIQSFTYTYDCVSYSLNNITFVVLHSFGRDIICSAIIENNVYNSTNVLENFVENPFLYVYNSFNLYQIMATDGTITINFAMDYNPNNYNGESYSDYNSLIPNKGTLYNNQSLIFSRNLYNKTLLNNSTVSTVEIPNTMLNNVEISEQELVSETNMNMVDNLNSFTKNIYETVFLNYINILNVINEDTNTQYPVVASYINENINTGTQSNYEDTQCNKYRINYADSTTDIQTFSWASLDEFNSKMSITLTVDKAITSIDLLSNDETTVYLNIPLEVEVGNTYTINQKVRTGEKVQPVQLYYNNEEIMYNNQNVMVYVKE